MSVLVIRENPVVSGRPRRSGCPVEASRDCRGGIPSLPLLDRIARAIGFRLAVSLCRERAA